MADDVSTRIERTLQEQLDAACAAGIFPGASASVGVWHDAAWTFTDVVSGVRGEGLDRVRPDTVYDLASVTKPWVATAALRLHQAGVFGLHARVDELIVEAQGLSIGERSWEEVLGHRSGLAAWVPFYESVPRDAKKEVARAWVLAELLQHWDASAVGRAVYSDLGYILAGIALERAASRSLQDIVSGEVSARIGLDDVVFFGAGHADDGWKAHCAPTGWSTWRKRALLGEVHDDNCAALSGIAGHAGMFGPARGVARFGAACVSAWRGRMGAMEEELMVHATRARPGGTHRLGWDGKDERGSAAGSLIDADAFGHLGFTGTSLWCDPHRQLVVVLLSNRVAVSDDNAEMRAFRPTFHDAVVRAFDEG